MTRMPPLVILVASMALVIALIALVRVHAFLALVVGGLFVGIVSPALPWAETASTVAGEFGTVTGRVGLVIALASIIGLALQQSGGASRISEAFLGLTGERRAHYSLWASGYVLSVPVFFDTVFYLLAPIARAMHQRTRHSYSLYLMATFSGAAATHVFVPPTPGPLAVGATLGVDIGQLLLVGVIVAIPASLAGIAYGVWANRHLTPNLVPLPMSLGAIEAAEDTALDRVVPPALWVAFLPIVLPVALIGTRTILTAIGMTGPVAGVMAFLGDPNFALLASAVAALVMVKRACGWSLRLLGKFSEGALGSAGSIILITAAGGAYGGMLTRAGVGASLAELASDFQLPILLLAFGVSSLIKVAQGSSTVAMITTASILQGIYVANPAGLPAAVYAALAVSGGSLVGSWMNDSGFWVVSRIGGLNEADTFRTWTAVAAVVGTTGFLIVLLLSVLVPLT
jgi:gluconate:H+ symporter, GntP family